LFYFRFADRWKSGKFGELPHAVSPRERERPLVIYNAIKTLKMKLSPKYPSIFTTKIK
jgi:hypothetical protein